MQKKERNYQKGRKKSLGIGYLRARFGCCSPLWALLGFSLFGVGERLHSGSRVPEDAVCAAVNGVRQGVLTAP